MPAFLTPLLIKLALAMLQKLGVITGFDAALIKAGTHTIKAIEKIKTYSAPSDFPTEVHSDGV